MIRNQAGAILTEVLLAVALFAVVAAVTVSMLFASVSSTKQGSDYVVAGGLVHEGVEAVRSIRWRDFDELVSGTHGLNTASGYYELFGTSNVLIDGVYTRTITIEDVYRDGNNDIAVSGTLDSDTKRVIVNVTWDTLDGKTQNIDTVFYVYNFASVVGVWPQTLTAEFTLGSANTSTVQAATGNGEVVLGTIDGTWTTTVGEYTVDVAGTGDPTSAWYEPIQDIVYVSTTNTSGDDFLVYDVSGVSGGAPSLIAGYDTGGLDVNDFVISGEYAYIATNSSSAEVHVVRLSDMMNVNTIDIEGTTEAFSIAVAGTTLLVGRNGGFWSELYAFDVSSPEGTISDLGNTELGLDCDALDTDGLYAYCGSDNDSKEIVVIRLSDYTEVNSVDLSGSSNVNDVRVVGQNLYVATDDGWSSSDFFDLDISNPTSTISVSNSLDTSDDVLAISVDANEEFAFLATDGSSTELTVVDLATFSESTTYDTTGNDDATAIASFGGYVYVLTERDGEELNVIASSGGGWTVPTLIGSDDTSGTNDGEEIFVEGNYAYLVSDSGTDELFIYDISTPSSPVLLGDFDVGDDVTDIVVSGNYAYLATADDSRELDIIDISTKTSPTRVGSYNLNGNDDAYAIDISGDYVYLGRNAGGGSGRNEFEIFDASDPSSPTILGSYNFGSDINDLVVSGDYVFAATSDNSEELLVIDVSTPSSPSNVGSYNLSSNDDAEAIAISGNLLAVGRIRDNSNPELYLFDISSPTSPSLSGYADVSSTINDIAFSGSEDVFLATDTNGGELEYWDVSTPASPSQTSTFDVNGDAKGVMVGGSYAYVASENDSLEFQIVGAGALPDDYAKEGTYTSQAYDSGSASTNWTLLEWTETIGGGSGFKMEVGTTTASSSFSTVSLTNSYTNPVVIPMYYESSNSLPASVRLDNIGSSSFDIALQNPGGSVLSSDTVHYLVIEEGAWTMPDGTLIEAHTISTNTTAYKNHWNGDSQSYTHTYSSAPVVLHQVQTFNDSSWIETVVYSPSSTSNPPTTSGFRIALNGAEAVSSHGTETIGWIAMETGTGSIDGIDFEASQTSDSVLGHDNGCNTFSFVNSYSSSPIVIADAQEQDGGDGGWGVMCSLTSSQVGFHEEEDQESDSERAHTSETFGGVVFAETFNYSDAGDGAIIFRVRTASSQAGLAMARWVGSDGTMNTSYSSTGTAVVTDPGATGTRWVQWKAYFTGDGASTPSLEDVTMTYAQ